MPPIKASMIWVIDGLRFKVYRTKQSLPDFVNITSYVGFAQIIDNANEANPFHITGIDRTMMDQLWVLYLAMLYKKWDDTGVYEKEDHKAYVLFRGILKMWDPKTEDYWKRKLSKYELEGYFELCIHNIFSDENGGYHKNYKSHSQSVKAIDHFSGPLNAYKGFEKHPVTVTDLSYVTYALEYMYPKDMIFAAKDPFQASEPIQTIAAFEKLAIDTVEDAEEQGDMMDIASE